ncbi:hypothetical protein [Streptomyces sp. ST2-7A]|uniref:hypothetical protein n=1 Tax=Streptomyces sp. ST2-7A TaxID=2907214 RepID=UPI001F2E07A4|nr:hypothetical protein [Streptomyces sp. ST2-7A]MCE7081559.1 hypothetical protein [Streptomyces sp. ST2-7A]
MPDLLVAPRVGAASSPSPSGTVKLSDLSDLSDLSAGERGMALYVSEMPTGYRYRRGDEGLVETWISQGAERVGTETLHEWDLLQRGYVLLDLEELATEEISTRHRALFPNARRVVRSRQLGALTILWQSSSPETIARGAVDAAAHTWRAYTGTDLYPGYEWDTEGDF